MADDSKRSPDSRFGRAIRLGKRIGQRASKRMLAARSKVPEVPEEPVMVVFEMARPGQAPVEALQPGGISLLAAAARAGVDIDHYCGGQCSCGTCRIEIIEGSANLSEQDGMEQMVLGSANVAAGNRLACQARILGPVRVRVPQWF